MDLLREIERLRAILRSVSDSIPAELGTYYGWAAVTCDGFRQQVMQNLHDLDSGHDNILRDVLSNTQLVTVSFHQYNQRLVGPILRARPSDRLCLKLFRWLHSVHPQTLDIPAALSDGEFGIWPVPPQPTIYFMPSSAQHGLLYLPLFFHELGHLLYACHKPEMDDVVRSFQEKISELLEPSMQRDDLYAQVEAGKRSAIVETWYEWAQEFFCDAVGFVIGGTAFVHAFSMYLRMIGRGEYHLPPEQLAHREHPVTWLRIRLLADRMRRVGHNVDAEELENAWNTIAEAMGVIEDYYGFYASEFLRVIQQTIDDMLTEASPFGLNEEEERRSEIAASSPIPLLNEAWHQFLSDPERYYEWEKKAVVSLLTS